MLRFRLVVLIGLYAATPAAAASWADALFDEVSKDFGSVPRGPTLTHHFSLKNKTGAPVHLSGTGVSCGCVAATILKPDLAPGEATAVQVVMDTRRFTGFKGVTVFVRFDRPQWEEVRLYVQANARDEVSVVPDTFAFGSVKRGSAPAAAVTISILGGSQWKVLEVQRESNFLEPVLQELRRTESEVAYQLTVRLRPDTPVGRWFTDLWVVTNNPALPRVRVPLTVEVEPALSVSPATLTLGPVKAGAETERKIIVRGVKPFRITEVKGTDDLLSVRDTTRESRVVHVLEVTLKARDPGELSRTVRILTDLQDEGEVEFQAKAQVVPE
jgi:hypothetical protein